MDYKVLNNRCFWRREGKRVIKGVYYLLVSLVDREILFKIIFKIYILKVIKFCSSYLLKVLIIFRNKFYEFFNFINVYV